MKGKVRGVVVVSTLLPAGVAAEAREIQDRYTKYRKVQTFKEPIKAVYLSDLLTGTFAGNEASYLSLRESGGSTIVKFPFARKSFSLLRYRFVCPPTEPTTN